MRTLIHQPITQQTSLSICLPLNPNPERSCPRKLQQSDPRLSLVRCGGLQNLKPSAATYMPLQLANRHGTWRKTSKWSDRGRKRRRHDTPINKCSTKQPFEDPVAWRMVILKALYCMPPDHLSFALVNETHLREHFLLFIIL